MIQGIKPTDKIRVVLQVLPIDYNAQKVEELRQKIATKYNLLVSNVEVETELILNDADGQRLVMTSDVVENIQNPKFQQQLFKEYLDIREYDDVDFDAIIDIDNQINAGIDFEGYSKYKSYKIKTIRWDNFLSYGKGNEFNFDSLKGLVLVNAENQQGKTTFCIDLIRFVLFGKSDKAPTLDRVFNLYFPEETEVVVEATLEIDGEDYVIRRSITRPPLSKRTSKSKPKQTVNYYRVIGDGREEINCEAENTQQTNNVIKDAIGTMDDFNLIISANAHTLGDLVRLGETERGRTFSRWLGLLTLEAKEKLAKDFYKNKILPTLCSTRYNKATLEEDIANKKNLIDLNQKEIYEISNRQREIETHVNDLNTQVQSIFMTRRQINESLARIDVTTLERSIQNDSEMLASKTALYQQLEGQIAAIQNVVYNEALHQERLKVKNGLEVRNGEIKGIIGGLRNKINEIKSLIAKNVCPTCGQPINVQSKNIEIATIESNINGLIEEGVNNKSVIDGIMQECQEFEQSKRTVQECHQLQLRKATLTGDIATLRNNVENNTRIRQEIENNRENVAFNNEIDAKINIINNEINMSNRNKEQLIRDIQTRQVQNTNLGNEIKNAEEIIGVINKEEIIIRNWTIYNELVGKNGIIKLVLKRSLPIINNEINRLLQDLCDFSVMLDVTPDNKVDISLVRDGAPLDLSSGASGFEMTMASVAIRTALASVSAIAKPNFVVYDEIIGTIHANNYETFKELLMRVSKQYQCILHITHAEDIFPIHDTVIKIVKENNISKISVQNGKDI